MEGVSEIHNRKGQVKFVSHKMQNILSDKSLSLELRNTILACYTKPILTDDCESGTNW